MSSESYSHDRKAEWLLRGFGETHAKLRCHTSVPLEPGTDSCHSIPGFGMLCHRRSPNQRGRAGEVGRCHSSLSKPARIFASGAQLGDPSKMRVKESLAPSTYQHLLSTRSGPYVSCWWTSLGPLVDHDALRDKLR